MQHENSLNQSQLPESDLNGAGQQGFTYISVSLVDQEQIASPGQRQPAVHSH